MEQPTKKVLVTGINGFLGSHILQQLLQKGYLVRGTVRDKSNKSKLEFLQKLPSLSNLEVVEADLLKPETLTSAVKGCNYVLHVASPFPIDAPADESVLIKPAVEGTLAILKSCSECPEVKHVIVTSSIVAIAGANKPVKPLYNEEDWAEPEGSAPYNKSKILAEKAAWEFYHGLDPKTRFKLTVINPGFMLGPSLISGDFTSGDRIKKMLTGEFKFIGKISFCVTDVRDVAAAHIAAIESDKSDGKRYICYSGETLWFEDVARILREAYGTAYDIPTFVVNECPIKDPKNYLAQYWGKQFKLDNSRAQSELGIKFTPAKESVLKMAQSLIENGVVLKKQ